MQVNIESLVSITEANQNFSKVARMVDEHGVAVILKNNAPRYVILEYSQLRNEEAASDEAVDQIGRRLIERHRRAFEELAK